MIATSGGGQMEGSGAFRTRRRPTVFESSGRAPLCKRSCRACNLSEGRQSLIPDLTRHIIRWVLRNITVATVPCTRFGKGELNINIEMRLYETFRCFFQHTHQLIVLLTYGVLPARENGTMYRHHVEKGLHSKTSTTPPKSFKMPF